jgi:DNA invertase Pin-like site-specific DNA recombinase
MVAQDDAALERYVAQTVPSGKPKPKPKPTPRIVGAFLYLRVSKPKKVNGVPVEDEKTAQARQERMGRLYVEKKLGIPILEVFREEARSGLLRRKEWERCLAKCQAGLASHLVVQAFDRTGRRQRHMLEAYEKLSWQGVEVHDCRNGKIDFERASKEAQQAEQEARNTGRRILDAILDHAQHPELFPSPRRIPFGYVPTPGRLGEPTVHDIYGKVITELFCRYDTGDTLEAVTTWFTTVTGQHRRPTSVRTMLQNEFYAGIDVFNKRSNSKFDLHSYTKRKEEWIVRRHNQPLIDEPTFHRVQERLRLNKNHGQQRKAGPTYPLTGLVLCQECGLRLRGHAARQKDGPRKRSEGPALLCHNCRRSRAYGRVEALVRQALREVPLLEAVKAGAHDASGLARVDALTAQIEKVKERRARLLIRRENRDPDDPFTDDDYRRALAQTKDEMEMLVAERDAASEAVTAAAGAEETLRWLRTITDWTSILDPAQTTPAERNAIYKLCVEKLVIDFAAGTLRIDWSPALARLAGTASVTRPLPRGRGGPQGGDPQGALLSQR